MIEHTATIATAPWLTTVTCACGWTFEHPDPSIAESRHTQHVGIEQARKALRKETAE